MGSERTEEPWAKKIHLHCILPYAIAQNNVTETRQTKNRVREKEHRLPWNFKSNCVRLEAPYEIVFENICAVIRLTTGHKEQKSAIRNSVPCTAKEEGQRVKPPGSESRTESTKLEKKNIVGLIVVIRYWCLSSQDRYTPLGNFVGVNAPR